MSEIKFEMLIYSDRGSVGCVQDLGSGSECCWLLFSFLKEDVFWLIKLKRV